MKLVETGSIVCADIVVPPDRVRKIDPAWERAIASSIEQKGQLQPIGVMKVGNELWLGPGGHRLGAMNILKRPDIRADIFEPETDNPAAELRMFEVTENLFRNELSVLDRAASLAEYKRLYEELHPETRHGGGKKSKRLREESKSQFLRLTQDVAEKIGLSERSVQAAVALWNGLTPETREAVAGTWLADHRSQLAALSKVEPKKQAKVVALLMPATPGAEAKASTVGAALSIIDNRIDETSPDEAAFNALVKAWHKASKKAQRRFVAYLREHKAVGAR